MIEALSLAAAEAGVDVEIDVREEFRGYAHDERSPHLRIAAEAMPRPASSWRQVGGGGGSDANVFNARGAAGVNLGRRLRAGAHAQERITLAHLEQACELGARPGARGRTTRPPDAAAPVTRPVGRPHAHAPLDPEVEEFLDYLRFERG